MPQVRHTLKISNLTHLSGHAHPLSLVGGDITGGARKTVKLTIPVQSYIELDLHEVQFDADFANTLSQWIDEGLVQVRLDGFLQTSVQVSTYKYGGASVPGANFFTDLQDVPADYLGHAGEQVVVKPTEDGLEFATVAGGISILFNGAPLGPGVTKLNFVNGQDPATYDGVLAQLDSDPTQVNAFIHPPAFVSHFNTMDGTTNALVPAYATFNRYLSNPGAFDITGWVAGNTYAGFHQTPPGIGGPIPYTLAGNFSILLNDGSSTFRVFVTSANGAVIADHGPVGIPAVGYSATVNNITINIGALAGDSYKFQASLSVAVLIDNIIPQGGKYSITLVHDDGAEGIFTYSSGNLFHDPNTNPAVISGGPPPITIVDNVIVGKWLSGIRYYIRNDTFTIGITGIDNINCESYPQPFVTLNATDWGIGSGGGVGWLTLNSADLIGWTTAWNNTGASHSATYTITRVNYRFISPANAFVYSRPEDWVAGAWVNDGGNAVCIDTFLPDSDGLNEYYTDEARRRTAFNLTGAYNPGVAWVSTQDMQAYDDNAGAMVQSGQLQRRVTNWTGHRPGLGANADYSGAQPATQTFYRRYQASDGTYHGSCRFTFNAAAVVADLLASRTRLWVFIPNGVWRIRGRAHSGVLWAATFNLAVQNGGVYDNVLDVPIYTASAGNTLDVSFGSFGLGGAYMPINYFEMHLELTALSTAVSSIQVSW